jgi:tetratricopeptide (TPR) repeat protein
MWQRDNNFAQAETQFLAAAKLDAQRYGQRALLEAADMQRRQKRNEEALASYAQVVTLDAASSRAQEARVWQGRVLQSMGRLDESIGAFRKAVDGSSKPRQVMEATNYLAKALILKGDFDNAESALQHAEEIVNKVIAADAVQADALHKALDGMSARKALQKARDKQHGASKDAKALEEVKGGSLPK